jgi:hypothetical protein
MTPTISHILLTGALAFLTLMFLVEPHKVPMCGSFAIICAVGAMYSALSDD